MRVFVVRNPNDRVKGYLRQHGLEVDPNVFVTDITKQDAEEVWNHLIDLSSDLTDFKALLIQPETVKPGFSVKGFGDKSASIEEVDGLMLKVKKKSK